MAIEDRYIIPIEEAEKGLGKVLLVDSLVTLEGIMDDYDIGSERGFYTAYEVLSKTTGPMVIILGKSTPEALREAYDLLSDPPLEVNPEHLFNIRTIRAHISGEDFVALKDLINKDDKLNKMVYFIHDAAEVLDIINEFKNEVRDYAFPQS